MNPTIKIKHEDFLTYRVGNIHYTNDTIVYLRVPCGRLQLFILLFNWNYFTQKKTDKGPFK